MAFAYYTLAKNFSHRHRDTGVKTRSHVAIIIQRLLKARARAAIQKPVPT